MSDKAPPASAPVLEVDDDAPPPEYRPNPKVAVVVAGAALAVTVGLTLLVIPYVRQAAKIQAPPQFLSHTNKARLPRLPTASASASAKAAGAAESAPPMAADISPELAKARSFNDSEENRLYGPDPNVDEHGEPIEPASPWLGFQALGIATALVGLSAGLGIFGAAKFLGVSSMEEFAHKMRGGLEGTYPEFIAQVRREGAEAPPETPTLLTRHGELDEPKFDDWIRSIEIEEAAEAEVARRVALVGASDAPVSALPAAQGLSDSTRSPVLAAVTQREQWAERVASSDRRLV